MLHALLFCNLRGIVMFLATFMFAIACCEICGLRGEGPGMMIGGALLLLIDLTYRLNSEDGHWLSPKRGGKLFLLPAWWLGLFWVFLGYVYWVRTAE